MPISTNTQVSFGGGLNAVVVPHLLTEGEVASAADVDFSISAGAASARRGSVLLNVVNSSTNGFGVITRNYNGTNSSLDTSPWYWICGSGTGPFMKATFGTNGTFTQTQIGSGASSANASLATTYQNFTYLANGSKAYRNDGTNTWE